jgi:predicted N-acetyltransferase YhbS
MRQVVSLHRLPSDDVEHLLDAAFGERRKERTAYLLRKDLRAISDLSFAVVENGALLGSIQCWPVKIVDSNNRHTSLIMVGPVAVAPEWQNMGIGKQLMHASLSAAEKLGNPAMMMIGDPDYYGRFGFTASQTSGWQMPGPWEAHRLLLRNIANQELPFSGMLAADMQYAL